MPLAQQIREREFRVGFFSCYNRLGSLLICVTISNTIRKVFFVYDIPTFNERVVREAILNAVSHRNYQMGGACLSGSTKIGL